MNRDDYLRLRQQIEEDYRRKIEALELVWRIANEICAVPAPTESEISEESTDLDSGIQPAKGELQKAIQDAIRDLRRPFTVSDVEDKLRAQRPDLLIRRSSISSALQRMAAAECASVEVVQLGAGQRPNIYERVSRHGSMKGKISESQVALIRRLRMQLGLAPAVFNRKFVEPCGVTCERQLTAERAEELLKELHDECKARGLAGLGVQMEQLHAVVES